MIVFADAAEGATPEMVADEISRSIGRLNDRGVVYTTVSAQELQRMMDDSNRKCLEMYERNPGLPMPFAGFSKGCKVEW